MFKTHKITSSFYYSGSSTIYSGSNLLWTSGSNYAYNNFIYSVDNNQYDSTNEYYLRFWIRKYGNYSGSFTVLFTSSLGQFTSSKTISSGSDFTMSYNYTYDKKWFGVDDITSSMVTHSLYDPNYNYFDFDITNLYSQSISAGFSTHSVNFYVTSSNPDVSYSLFSNQTLSKYYPQIIEKYQIKSTGSLPPITEYTASEYSEYIFKVENNKEYYNSQSYYITMSCYPKYYTGNSFTNWSPYDDTDWIFRHPELYYRIREKYDKYETIPYPIDENFQWVSWNSSSNYIYLDFDSIEEGYYSIDIYDKDNNTYYNNLYILRVDK